jgi:hypothetical protein
LFEWPLVIPQGEGVDFGLRTPRRVISVYNDGAADIGMRVRFVANGNLSGPALVNARTFAQIKLNLDMRAGDVAEVQTAYGRQSVTLTRAGEDGSARPEGGLSPSELLNSPGETPAPPQAGQGATASNAFWAWDVDNTFLQLSRGDNLFRFDADSGADLLDVMLYIDIAYAGV